MPSDLNSSALARFAMFSNKSVDFPLPLGPVITLNLLSGIVALTGAMSNFAKLLTVIALDPSLRSG